MSNIMRTHCK